MSVCTFFGHSSCPEQIQSCISREAERLYLEKGVTDFLVGNHGEFDHYAKAAVRELALKYPAVRYSVVLAYLPTGKDPYTDDSDTVLPDGIETTPRRFAITYRNNWMLSKADYVIAYIVRDYRGAVQFYRKALRQNKNVINLAEQQNG